MLLTLNVLTTIQLWGTNILFCKSVFIILEESSVLNHVINISEALLLFTQYNILTTRRYVYFLFG